MEVLYEYKGGALCLRFCDSKDLNENIAASLSWLLYATPDSIKLDVSETPRMFDQGEVSVTGWHFKNDVYEVIHVTEKFKLSESQAWIRKYWNLPFPKCYLKFTFHHDSLIENNLNVEVKFVFFSESLVYKTEPPGNRA